MNRLSLLLPLTIASLAMAQAQTTVEGMLTGTDGKPMPLAHVHLVSSPSNPDPIATAQAASDGKVKLTVNEPGIYALQLTGVDHQMDLLPLLVTGTEPVRFEARLAPNMVPKDLDGVKIIGDFNKFNFKSAVDMKRQPDGTFTAEFDATGKEFKYQVLLERSFNGTQSERYEYDGGGDYRSIVTPKGGKVKIVFDPRTMAHADVEPQARFENSGSVAARYLVLIEKLTDLRKRFSSEMRDYAATGKDPSAFSFDATKDLARLSSTIDEEKETMLRHVAMVYYLGIQNMTRDFHDSAVARRALAEIPPSSTVWSRDPDAVSTAINLTGQHEYLDRVLAGNANTELKAQLLFNEVGRAQATGDTATLRRLYTRLMTDYGTSQYAKAAKSYFNPDRAVVNGRAVPTFSFASIADPKTVYTNESFKGKYYMIDFWATWCGPCIREMESLHKAYEKFRGPNFEIISLSFDDVPGKVTSFRDRKWKMPWLHSFIDGGFDSPAAKAFEVAGIPKPILVDPNGRIVAMQEELRGSNLEKTLARFLGDTRMGEK